MCSNDLQVWQWFDYLKQLFRSGRWFEIFWLDQACRSLWAKISELKAICWRPSSEILRFRCICWRPRSQISVFVCRGQWSEIFELWIVCRHRCVTIYGLELWRWRSRFWRKWIAIFFDQFSFFDIFTILVLDICVGCLLEFSGKVSRESEKQNGLVVKPIAVCCCKLI